MQSPLLDVAMAFVKQSDPQFANEDALQAIREAFRRFIYNREGREELFSLLMRYINTVDPLTRVDAILSVPMQPLPVTRAPFDSPPSLRKKTRPWSEVEDIRLFAGIHQFGLDDWVSVARFVGNGRSRAQCAQRWIRGLDPRISKNQWTHEDEEKLLDLIRNSPDKGWTNIAAAMGNRSDVQCRYHFLQMQKEGLVGDDVRYPGHDRATHAPLPRPPNPSTLPVHLRRMQGGQGQRIRRYSSEMFSAARLGIPQPPMPMPPSSPHLPITDPMQVRNVLSQPRLPVPAIFSDDTEFASDLSDHAESGAHTERASDATFDFDECPSFQWSMGNGPEDPSLYDVIF